jgi:hypothetical protein
MDAINPWLDPVEVRRLADRLLQPAAEPPTAVADAGFDEGFEGFARAAAPPAATISSDQPAAKPAQPQVETDPRAAARGSFLRRIHHFRDWMRDSFTATGLFLLDRDGAVIFDESNHGRLHFLARSLAVASRRPGASSGNVHVKIGAGATLEVVPVDTAYGSLVLGAVVPEPLDPDAISAVMQALCQIASPRAGES